MKITVDLPSDANASGRSFGDEELALLKSVIESGTLNSTRGSTVKQLEEDFRKYVGVEHAWACSSGTAAVHTAVAAIDPEPGDEIVSTPITDMGGITPIVYQTAIPVFADVDPRTYNVTADTIEKVLTARTKAVIVTHLFGNPCDMDPILELCNGKGLPVIEDCAQAYGATYKGKSVGTLGAIGAFSLQQGKHMSTGEGGLVTTRDPDLSRRMRLFIDKAWGYGDAKPDHYFLAVNYRLNELAGAVGVAQLAKLPGMVTQRQKMAARLSDKIAGAPGVEFPATTPGGVHTYWKVSLRIDPQVLPGGSVAFGGKLKDAGIFCAPRYIVKPAFECEVLRDHRGFGKSEFPWVGEHRKNDPPVVYDRANTPGTVEALDNVVVLPINEKYTERHIDAVAEVICSVAAELSATA